MFERNKIDNTPAMTAIPATVTFAGGTREKGRLFILAGRNLTDTLNSAAMFIEFEPYGGTRTHVAKSQIFSVEPIGVPKVPALPNHSAQREDFDPHTILGVAPAADWPTVRAAFVERTKAYHPDRFASVELPAEVRAYLAAIARRINLAYEVLEEAQQVRKEVIRTRTEPIYTSRARM